MRLALFALLLALGLPCDAWPIEWPALSDSERTVKDGISAWLIDPTKRYDHAVLGDAVEAGGFAVEMQQRRLSYRLGPDAVFEDRRVRIADIDGDGWPEAILIKSYLDRGSAIAVYRLTAQGIEPLAESKPIGRRHRWLNIVGVADFTGAGKHMIAAVITPHLAGSLRLYRLAGQELDEVARLDGFTNHILGSRDIDLARVGDVLGIGLPQAVLPTLDRKSLAVVMFRDGRPEVARSVPVAGGIVSFVRIGRGTATIRSGGGTEIALDLR